MVPRLVALFTLALLVRFAPLGRYVTPDEPIWVMRSVRFADAVASGDWAAVPQTGHPGLTTMALGALGVRVMAAIRPTEAATHLAWIRTMAWLAPENGAAFPHLAFFLPAGRALAILATALGIVLVYGMGRSRLGERAARLLALFLALDPFFAGLAGLLHTDALQATFVLLAALLALPRRELPACAWLPLVGSGACLALAGMTKTLGLLVAPGLALAMILLGRGPWWKRALRVAFLAAVTAILAPAIYLPFWADPAAALASLIEAASFHEGIGLRNVFFAGQMTADPGPLFYPAVLLFRLTPAALLGLALSIRGGRRAPTLPRSRIPAPSAWWFVLPALVYLAALTVATKKFDRYALSAMTLLTAVAALAWGARALTRVRRWVLPAALLLPWAVVAPLPLYYADPLTGGPWLAQHVVPLGWGEGSGLAAAQLARLLPEPAANRLLAANVPGAAPFFPGATSAWDASLAPCADALILSAPDLPAGYGFQTAGEVRLAGLRLATMATRTAQFPDDPPLVLPGLLPGAPADAVAPAVDTASLRAWLTRRLPVSGTFTWVHAPACYPVTEAQLATLLGVGQGGEPAARCEPAGAVAGLAVERCVLRTALPAAAPFLARFGGALDLLAAAWPEQVRASEALAVRLRWQPQAPQDDLSYYVALQDAEGQSIWAEGGGTLVDDRTWRSSAWAVGALAEGETYVLLPRSLPPGAYSLTLSLQDGGGRWQGLWRADGTFGGTRLALGIVQILPPVSPAADLPGLSLAVDAEFSGLHLIAAELPGQALWAGDPLPFSLGWERIAGDPPDTLRWELICAGAPRAAGELPLAPSGPAAWPAGYRFVTHYAPRTDPLQADGQCALKVQAGQAGPVSLGMVELRRRERRFELPNPPQAPLNVALGAFARLVGADLPAASVSPGETISVTLYVQAQAAADLDYTVFVHLVGPDGQTWAQSDVWPEQGNAPTTSWVAGQIIVDTHTLEIAGDAPDGAYALFVGFYDAESGGRVPLYDEAAARLPDDQVRVGTLSLETGD